MAKINIKDYEYIFKKIDSTLLEKEVEQKLKQEKVKQFNNKYYFSVVQLEEKNYLIVIKKEELKRVFLDFVENLSTVLLSSNKRYLNKIKALNNEAIKNLLLIAHIFEIKQNSVFELEKSIDKLEQLLNLKKIKQNNNLSDSSSNKSIYRSIFIKPIYSPKNVSIKPEIFFGDLNLLEADYLELIES